MSLKHKLTLLFATALVFLMFVTALATRRMARLTVESEIHSRIFVAAMDTRDALQREIDRREYLTKFNAVSVLAHALSTHPSITHADLTCWDGRAAFGFSLIITPYGPDYQDLKPYRKIVNTDPEIYRNEYWFVRHGIKVRLGIGASLAEADQLTKRFSRTFIFSTGGSLLFLLAIIYALSHRLVSAPLRDLWQLTRRVAKGELDAEPSTALSKRKDEVGILSASFQDMLLALRKAREKNQALLLETQGFNRQLEARVTEATHALAEKNQALTEAREELSRRERLAALGQLAGSIAHELGTPLSTLSGYLQLVLADPNLTPEHHESLEVAAGEAQRMTRIIRRFLDSTRGLRPAPEKVTLKALLDNVLELTHPPGTPTGLTTRFDLSDDALEAETDPGLLRQVLINLVNNASDATGGHGTIIFRSRLEDASVLMEVEDDGPGIPPDKRSDIFEPFYTTKAPERGTGLGLAISREIMRALKGTLTVEEAQSGNGARFIIRVPHTFPGRKA